MRVQCAEQGKVWGRSWRGAGSGSQAAAPRSRRSYVRWRAARRADGAACETTRTPGKDVSDIVGAVRVQRSSQACTGRFRPVTANRPPNLLSSRPAKCRMPELLDAVGCVAGITAVRCGHPSEGLQCSAGDARTDKVQSKLHASRVRQAKVY